MSSKHIWSALGGMLLLTWFATASLAASEERSFGKSAVEAKQGFVAEVAPAIANESSRTRFQRQINLTCNGGSTCTGTFFTVPLKTFFELDFATCYANAPNNQVVYEVYLRRSNPNGPPFYQDLALAWQTSRGTTNLYSFEKATRLFAHPGTSLTAFITGDGPLGFNYCNVFGDVVKLQ